MRLALIALMLAACTDDGPSSGGPDVTSHVESLHVVPGTPGCFTGTPFDADAATAGPQYDCSVTKTASGGVYAQCNNATTPSSSTNQPCWAIASNTACTMGGHFELQIVPQVTEEVSAQCLVQ